MLAIVRVTRQQLDDFRAHTTPGFRRYLGDVTINHVYVPAGNVLYVCDEDTELFQFPADRRLSIAETIRAMVEKRVKKDECEQVTGG